MSWRIADSSGPAPAAVQPYSACLPTEGPEAASWFFMVDHATPAIDFDGNGLIQLPCEGGGFVNSTDTYLYATILKPKLINGIFTRSIQSAQDTFFPSTNPDYLFFQANFWPAAALVNYKTRIIIEFFSL